MFLVLLSQLACSPGCGADMRPDDAPSLLEAFRVSGDASPGDYDGALAIAAAQDAGDYAISGAGVPGLTVHSPALTDLAAFDGTQATLTVATDDLYGATALALFDDDGLAWLAEPLDGGLIGAQLLGEDFVRYGSDVGEIVEGDYTLAVKTMIFAGDESDVEMFPGESASIPVGGALYRATVIAAYTAELLPGAEPTDCGGLADLLSYELVRIDAPEVRAPLQRPADTSPAEAGCGGLQ
jgi:hypothetical protein